MAEIINPNNPVYFTYARNSEEKAEWRHIADVVPDLLDAFRSEGVKYSVDAEDIKNGAKISSYEKEIGDANYVIVVLSDRYFYRYHCMFELSNVLKNTQGKTIKFIKSGNFNIKSIDYRVKIKEFWMQEKSKIDVRKATYINPDISELEQAAIDNNYYLDFIDSLASLFNSVSYTNAESLRKKLLRHNSDQVKFVTEIKKDFGWTVKPPKPPTPIPTEKYILYSLIAVLACVVLWLSIRKPDTVTDIDIITQVTDTIQPQGDTTTIITPKVDTTENLPPKDSIIDLGLSVLWADRNIGANSSTDYGDYFAWGETTPKDTYSWDNYQYCNGGDSYKLIKYCTTNYYGKVDNKEILDPEDDAVVKNWGNGWKMPTVEEYKELFANCDRLWTKKDGVNGYEFTSKKNGNKIFFSAAGWRGGGFMRSYASSRGLYWSSSLDCESPYLAYYFDFDSGYVGLGRKYDRYNGFPVRAVRRKN